VTRAPRHRPYLVLPLAVCLAALSLASPRPVAAAPAARLDVEAAQAILAVQRLDGWLLAQNAGQNSIAAELVGPGPGTTRQWFYFVPARGAPVALVHKSELGAFDDVPGRKIEYAGYRDLKAGLRTMLKGAKRVAMEYAPDSRIPTLTRVDAATVALVRSQGIKISSSAELVQFTKSLWGPEGRVAHYVAMHHLARLKDAALAHVAAELRAGRRLTEYDLQQFILRGYRMRGLDGPAPVVAAGASTGEAQYTPTPQRFAPIARGDLLLIDLSARVTDAERPIFARLAWTAYVGEEVPDRLGQVFGHVAAARDAAIRHIEQQLARKRVVKGFEADQQARAVIGRANLGDRFVHRTGHSLDTSLLGDGANLDDYETHDTRNLVMGSGFTVGPGVYVRGDFGIRSVVPVYIGRRGIEVTGPTQQQITAVLAP
jgi:Xaa-Pro aminopeptidase